MSVNLNVNYGAFKSDISTYSLEEMQQVLTRPVADLLRVELRTRSHDDNELSMWWCSSVEWILGHSALRKPHTVTSQAAQVLGPRRLGTGPSSS